MNHLLKLKAIIWTCNTLGKISWKLIGCEIWVRYFIAGLELISNLVLNQFESGSEWLSSRETLCISLKTSIGSKENLNHILIISYNISLRPYPLTIDIDFFELSFYQSPLRYFTRWCKKFDFLLITSSKHSTIIHQISLLVKVDSSFFVVGIFFFISHNAIRYVAHYVAIEIEVSATSF